MDESRKQALAKILEAAIPALASLPDFLRELVWSSEGNSTEVFAALFGEIEAGEANFEPALAELLVSWRDKQGGVAHLLCQARKADLLPLMQAVLRDVPAAEQPQVLTQVLTRLMEKRLATFPNLVVAFAAHIPLCLGEILKGPNRPTTGPATTTPPTPPPALRAATGKTMAFGVPAVKPR